MQHGKFISIKLIELLGGDPLSTAYLSFITICDQICEKECSTQINLHDFEEPETFTTASTMLTIFAKIFQVNSFYMTEVMNC